MAQADPLPRLRALCLAQPGATERPSHGEPTLVRRGPALFVTTPTATTTTGSPSGRPQPAGRRRALVEAAPDRFFQPPYVGHRGWVGVYLDVPVDWDEIAAIVADAWRSVRASAALA